VKEIAGIGSDSIVKIVRGGKVLDGGLLLREHIKAGDKLMLMVTGTKDMAEVMEFRPDPLLRGLDDTGSTKQAVKAYSTRETSQYRFHDMDVLPHFGTPPPSAARSMLERLASDPGILAIMKKYKWSVGRLSEMPPEGKVGVSDVCLMGLNRNAGQQILLRLRTDDLQGLRKFESVREVLLHELVHNKYSEHNADFWSLWRVLLREVNELSWKGGSAQSVNGNHQMYGGSQAEEVSKDGNAYNGGVFKLGTTTGNSGALKPSNTNSLLPVHKLAAEAALRRQADVSTDQRVGDEVMQTCPCGRRHGPSNAPCAFAQPSRK